MPKRQLRPDTESRCLERPESPTPQQNIPEDSPGRVDDRTDNEILRTGEQSGTGCCSAYSPSGRPASLPPIPSSVQVYFRISDIPLEWDVQRVKKLLADRCCIERATDHQITLYPSVAGGYQIGILALTGPRDYVDTFAPLGDDKSKRLVMDNDNHITIDRHFYGLTPLNTSSDEVVAE